MDRALSCTRKGWRPAGVLLLLAFGGGRIATAATIGPTSASPSSITVNIQSTIVFTAQITDPTVLPDGVNLLKTDASGRTLLTVGRMYDDGSNGDVVAGDNVFSRSVAIIETAAGSVYYRVSAAFKGVLLRTLSPLIPISVRGRPTISVTLSPASNANGWNNTAVTAHFECTPGGAPLVSCPPDQEIRTEGPNQTVSGTVTDASGASASVTSSQFSIDLTRPSVAIELTPPASNGWYTTEVTAHFACQDALSGITSCDADKVITSEGPDLSVSGGATDLAGNTQTTIRIGINIDRTAPTITVELLPPSPNGSYTGPVTARFTCTDAGSGIAGCPPEQRFTTPGVGLTATGTVSDVAGNAASVTSAPFSILTGDGPRITVTLSPEPNASGWNNTPVVAHFVCTAGSVPIATCPDDQTISTEGANQAVTGTVIDTAGNKASVTSAPFSIDLTAPGATVSFSPAPNANGWNRTEVIAHFSCNDGGSGVAHCPPDHVVSTEGVTQLVSGTAVDVAGNSATASGTVSIDRTPPLVTLSQPTTGTTGTTVFTPSVTLSGLVSDTGSGIANVTCKGSPASVTGGALSCVVALSPGANEIQATAIDRAGNSASSALTFTYVRVPIITINTPASLSYTSTSPTTVTGTVDDPSATVSINAIDATVVNGTFSLALPLAEGPNIVTATATSAAGATGTASLTVTLDTTPPRVTVTSPPDQFETTDASVSVSGIVNDVVVGTVNAEQAAVKVNGVTAQVANRTFLAGSVPLALGENVIQVVGSDRVGNQGTTQVVVTRRAITAQPRIQTVSGSGQTAAIRSLLPVPLIVALVDGAGSPVANKPVIFKVTQNDGLVGAAGEPAPTVIATTDAQGRAEARWTLGGRAGAGGNTVEAYSVGFEGTAIFTATGNQGAAGKIVVDAGNNQIGPLGQRLPRPFIAVVVDDGNNRLSGVPVTFTVGAGGGGFDGQESLTVVSDPDGRVAATLTLGTQEGNNNNLVSASFDDNQGFPATFTASGRAPSDPAKTSITGVVLDNSNVPIPGVTIRAVQTEVLHANGNAANAVPAVQTNAQGQFTVPQAPVGFVKLIVDGSTATLPGSYPTLDYDLVTVAGQINTVGQPVFLLPLNTDNSLCVKGSTGGGTLTIPEAPGFSLTFSPGQVTFPGNSKDGCISVTVVHPDKVPMSPGFGQQPRFIVTIQPAGASFNPPAAITLPNVDGLSPRAVTEMYSFDHDIGSFVAIGTGTVSDDGMVIRSNPGVGVLKAGWHCGGNPAARGTVADCPPCKFCQAAPPTVGTVGPDQCVPDPGQINQSCDSSFNDCIDGGRCGIDAAGSPTGKCVGGVPVTGRECNAGGTSRAMCVNGECKGNGDQCPTECTPASPNVCVVYGCTDGSCTVTPDDTIEPPQNSPNDCYLQSCRGGSISDVPDESEMFIEDPLAQERVCALYPSKCIIAVTMDRPDARDWAIREAMKGTFGPGSLSCLLAGGAADAARHAYWNCLMTRSLGGAEFAKAIGDAHEFDDDRSPAQCTDHVMDLTNNGVGRTLGGTEGLCSDLVIFAFQRGWLRINRTCQ